MSLEDKVKTVINNLEHTVKLLTGSTDEVNRYAIKFHRTICPLRLVHEEAEGKTMEADQ